MDTLIFGGLLATMLAVCRRASRTVVLGVWWSMLIIVFLLMTHHIAAGPSLKLSF
ncbi:DUF5993 family protein [Streptomyces sp. NPDC051907]|uniref:DUF5993 family protein n=1 Tax=Streptomyces sp. NPDC051907 TaxID=3155284 RepID=UPI00341B57E2